MALKCQAHLFNEKLNLKLSEEMMRYTPYTEAEIQSMNLIDEGEYPFEVIEIITVDKYGLPMRDKNGNDMVKLKLLLWDNQNRQRTLYTYLSGDGALAYKLRHFARSIGMIDHYEQGTFNIEQTIGKSGRAEIVIRKGNLKLDGSGEMWPDKNDVKDFIVASPEASKIYDEREAAGYINMALQQNASQSAEFEDDIPFN